MLNKIIIIYAITDDLLKAMPAVGYAYRHKDNIRRAMSDAEIITMALVAAIFFHSNHSNACSYMKDENLIPYRPFLVKLSINS